MCAGVSGLTRPDADTEAAKNYALQMADTVLVKEGGDGAELLTGGALRSWTDNAYFFKVRNGAAAPSCGRLPTLPVLGVLKVHAIVRQQWTPAAKGCASVCMSIAETIV